MASLDKLSKSFEFLRIPVQLYEPEQRRLDLKNINKKDKIHHLNFIHDNITSTSLRQTEEHTKMVSLSIDAFLNFFDDEDRDVVSVADDCLNKTIKTLLDTNLIRLQYDLFRFIRKNGPERSLRAALIRFAELSHLVKTHKCRMFVEFFVKENTLSKIAVRQEDLIQTCLVDAMTKICSSFCWSMTNNEVKTILHSFLPNLSNDSSPNNFRRVSAVCLSIICLYSRSPYSFYAYLHNELIKLCTPLDTVRNNISTIWAVLICYRYMIIHMSELDKSASTSSAASAQTTTFSDLINASSSLTMSTSPELTQSPTKTSSLPSTTPNRTTTGYFNIMNLCEIYELCIYILDSADNRLVTSALEVLQALIKLLPFKFDIFLTSSGSSHHSFLHRKQTNLTQTLSTVAANSLAAALEQPKPVITPNQFIGSFYSQTQTPVEHLVRFMAFKFLLNTENDRLQSKLKADSQVKVLMKTIALECVTGAISLRPQLLFYSVFINPSQRSLNQVVTKKRPKSYLDEIDTDDDDSEFSDNEEEDSNELTAMNIGEKNGFQVFIYDLVNYVDHPDDKMKANACSLIGQLINSVLVENGGDYDAWLSRMIRRLMLPRPGAGKKTGDEKSEILRTHAPEAYNSMRLEVLVDHLMRFIRFDSLKVSNNMCKKAALSSLHAFLPTLFQTKHASYCLEILINILHLRHSTYNLVKCELVDLVSSIDFKVVAYVESLLPGDLMLLKTSKSKTKNLHYQDINSLDEADEETNINQASNTSLFIPKNTQNKIVDEVLLYLLGSEDSKLRLETAKSLARLVSNLNCFELTNSSTQNVLLAAGEGLIKAGGYSSNLFGSGLVENDACNFGSIQSLFVNNSGHGSRTSSSYSIASGASGNRTASFNSTTSVLYSQKQIRYCCSPLSSVSFNSSIPWLSKSQNLINNTFIQPFNSLIKFWPSSASFTNSVKSSYNQLIEHNLNYLVPKLTDTLLNSVDKFQFIGCLETLDLIFQAYQPAIFYSSPTGVAPANTAHSDSNDYTQLYDLLYLMISLLKHPMVAFDTYVQDIVMRLIGELYCSYAWLIMKKQDKVIQQLNFILANTSSPQLVTVQSQRKVNSLLAQLQASLDSFPLTNSLCEQSTGLTYSYLHAFNNIHLKQSTDQLFFHLMRILCILACVIDEQALPSILTANLSMGSVVVTSTLSNSSQVSNTASNTSPNVSVNESNSPKTASNDTTINNRRDTNSSIKDTAILNKSLPLHPSNSVPESTSNKNTSSLPKPASNLYLGHFHTSSTYLKLYETLKVTFASYKKSPRITSHDRFLQLTKSTLKLFAQLLETGLSVHEVGPHLDEILLYLKVIFSVDPSSAVKCVTMSLKALFSLNLSGLMVEYTQQQITTNTTTSNQTKTSATTTTTTTGTKTSDPNPSMTIKTTMSSSITSITSLSVNTKNTNQQQTSLLSNLLANHLNQFTRFMLSQTFMSRSENLMGQIQIPIDQFLANTTIGSQLQLEDTTNLSSSNSSLNDTASISSHASVTSSATTTSTNTSALTNKSSNNFAANLFGSFLRKASSKESPTTTVPAASTNQADLQQKKIKQQKLNTKTITQYIKSFESIVIKSLRQYTFTTSVNLQARILELLAQLIFLKVDYCLLDSDKVFIEYVLKQFDHLEQKRDPSVSTSSVFESSSSLSNADSILNLDENGSGLLSNSYSVDIAENFDSETEVIDPLSPFDVDTMLNRVCVKLSGWMSETGGQQAGLVGVGGCAPILSSLGLRQQEHQRSHILIPKLFDFLILLSHEKRSHVQPVVQTQTGKANVKSSYKLGTGLLTVPEVMQLCDNLIASENSPHTHAIPALRPLVLDLYLNRSTDETKELDMQHDVIMKCMLRLIQYPQVWPLLSIAVLKNRQESDEKWKRVSRQICDALFDSMRSSSFSNSRLRFKEFNGYELRAIRRYSRAYVPWIESLKLLFRLLNNLAPQAFRPIDFILLSMFEVSRGFVLTGRNLTIGELNNWMCVLMVHVFVLLSHSTEEQILTRLYHLMPEIVHSYENVFCDTNFTSRFRPRSNASGNSRYATDSSDSELDTSSANYIPSSSDDEQPEESPSKPTPKSATFNLGELNNNSDSDMADSALYFSKFLLSCLDKLLADISPLCKFNASHLFSTSQSASSGSTLLRDFQINTSRDINHAQHLLANYFLFLLFILNSGTFPKISFALSSLINSKTPDPSAETQTNNSTRNNKRSKTTENITNPEESLSTPTAKPRSSSTSPKLLKPPPTSTPQYHFNLNPSHFTFNLNCLILNKLATHSPIISSLYHYLLLNTNYQSTDYWSSVLVQPAHTSSNKNYDSSCTTANNSLDPNLHNPKNLIRHFNRLQPTNLILKQTNIFHVPLTTRLLHALTTTAFCDSICNKNQLDNSTSLTMLLMNNLVDLFELAPNEPTVIDLFSTIHRNPAASSLFIHCISSSWSLIVGKQSLSLLYACLRSLEAVHLASSGHLLNFLIDKFFELPYLSLVRYADHIACQRVEMMSEPVKSVDGGDCLITEQHMTSLNKFFSEFKYSFRHKRLVSLLGQLRVSVDNENKEEYQNQDHIETTSTDSLSTLKPSNSIDFFTLYINNHHTETPNLQPDNLDKEWYYNIVQSACSYNSPDQTESHPDSLLLGENSSLKSKQSALMLSSLDYSNALTILTSPKFKLTILKDCLLLGAKQTQITIEKLPFTFKQAGFNIENDFMHPMWLAGTHLLFDLLSNLCLDLPKPPVISLSKLGGESSSSAELIYETKLTELGDKYDFYSFISPVTEAINAYLKCLRQYPSLLNQLTGHEKNKNTHNKKSATNVQKLSNLTTYIVFQLSYVNYISSHCHRHHTLVTLNALTESFLAFFNLLLDSNLLNTLITHPNYSALLSSLIKNFYQLIITYFYEPGDDLIIHTLTISPVHNIVYPVGHTNVTNDLLFSTSTLDLMLRLRFIFTNYRYQSVNTTTTADTSTESNSSSMNTSFCVSTNTHRFLQTQSHYFKQRIPFNMRDLCEKIYLSLCRLPVIDRFIRVPDALWRTSSFKLDYSQLLSGDSSALPPLDYLRDPILLKEHLKHILCVGWTSRTQFEYEYVNMLTLLHNLSEDYYPPAADQSFGSSGGAERARQILPNEEIKERNKCICLVIKGLSSWLIKSTLTPKSGSSLNSLYEQVSRNKVPQFIQTQLGQQYSSVKRLVEAQTRPTLFTNLNSTSIANNVNLLHMLDPTIIHDMDNDRRRLTSNLLARRPLDFTQPQPTADALANLIQISMDLRQKQHHLPFSSNIERSMIANLPTNADTYFHYGQVSLEGLIKFLGAWNKNSSQENSDTLASIAAVVSNFVTGSNPTIQSTVVDEVQNKTVNAFNNFIKVLTEDNPDVDDYEMSNSTSYSSLVNSTSQTEEAPNRPLQQTIQTEPTPAVSQLIQRSFNRNNLDLTSVLRTVLDYYESFFRHPCLQLKLEIFKSMVYLSNSLYESRQQYESLIGKMRVSFEWLDGFVNQELDELMLMPTVNELVDESVLGLGVYGDALCRCCLQASQSEVGFNVSNKELDRLNRMFENGLRSGSVFIKISTVQGIMYWLETIALGYFVNNNNDAKSITDHICKQITQMRDPSNYLVANSRYICTLWSAGFYAIENCLDSIRDAQTFISTFIKQTFLIFNDPNTPYFLFYQLYMGLERFLLSNMIPSSEINTIQKLLHLKFDDPQKSLCLTSLTVTSLYASNQSKQMNYWNDIIQPQRVSIKPSTSYSDHSETESTTNDTHILGYPQILELSGHPDLQANLLKVLEVATNFLDRMKASSTAKEASVYASLLPKVLCDFLPPHDLLNKLITEFLNSSQHPYPEAIAYILYKCFDLLQQKGLQSQIQEWCLLSLTSFLQRASIYESIWLSSCLLVSATRNQWLKATFPFLLNRYCSFETIDRAIFYMSVIEFRKQFQDIKQLQEIYAIFQAVAKPDTPYFQLIKLMDMQTCETEAEMI